MLGRPSPPAPCYMLRIVQHNMYITGHILTAQSGAISPDGKCHGRGCRTEEQLPHEVTSYWTAWSQICDSPHAIRRPTDSDYIHGYMSHVMEYWDTRSRSCDITTAEQKQNVLLEETSGRRRLHGSPAAHGICSFWPCSHIAGGNRMYTMCLCCDYLGIYYNYQAEISL
ncbi:hypothetical protein GDO81_027037 [Engystomops pustulosus]|uniref:Uncharacterized protein n=1 Tax=Engystomops pustulosus TaxID=76066 RepID=A0AAV6ZLL1_ENGPU|nr:hypothetical protein GDO81_027037 [Engystomops pustulosus]